METEALALHRFLEAGTLREATLLTARNVEVVASTAYALGLLVLPPGVQGAILGRCLGLCAQRFRPLDVL